MTNTDNRPDDSAELHRLAKKIALEEAARSKEAADSPSSEEMQQTLLDLRVHQIELEMQNEELRRAQAELDASRARYFDLYDLAPVGYVAVSEKGLILEANLTVATLLGVARGALVKQPFARFILAEDQDVFYRHSRQILETGEPRFCDLRMVKIDGEQLWVRLQAAAAQDNDGAPVYRGVLSDITERMRSEEAIKKIHAEAQNERLRLDAVMEVLPTGVVIADASGGTLQTNPEYNRIWAGPRPAIHSIEDYETFKAWWADSGKPLKPEEWASVRAVREGKSIVGQLLEIERFDGSHAFVINSAAPVRDTTGNIIGSAGTIHDITDLREAESRIKELNVALQAHVATVNTVNKELESYSHSVSHDLRTPLRFVNRIAHLLLHEPGANLSSGATQQVNMILQATDEMAKLIESLLAFSQVSREPITKRPIDLRRLFQEVAKELKHTQESCGVEIVIQTMTPCYCDRTLLKDVVVNLLTNALKFTRWRENARITIGCSEASGETVYFVQDNGVGFNMNDADFLFVPFHRLHNPSDFEGTGIGLALVKRIIERHGGRIWAEGEVDKGATFYFTLGGETTE
jgi:PAS domain S-box-containing protein